MKAATLERRMLGRLIGRGLVEMCVSLRGGGGVRTPHFHEIVCLSETAASAGSEADAETNSGRGMAREE